MENYNFLNFKINNPNIIFEYLFAKWVHKRFFKILGKLCDVGSGNGNNALAFQKFGYKVTALDYDDFYFKRLKLKNVECKKIDLNADKLPFKEGEIDYFFVKSVIEHLERPLDFLKEVYRSLRSGGKIFILTPDWEKNYKKFYSDPTHKSPFMKRSIEKALKMTGFKIIKIRNFRNIPYLWRTLGIRAFDYCWIFPKEMIAIAEKK